MKRGFRILSAYTSSLDIASWAWLICTYDAFRPQLSDLLQPLALDTPIRVGAHCRVSWPIPSWVEYLEARPALVEAIDFAGPAEQPGLHLIIRGDGYPVAGGTFCHLGIALANHGKEARRPAGVWTIGLATCPDKDMEDLGVLWAKNLEVCVYSAQ